MTKLWRYGLGLSVVMNLGCATPREAAGDALRAEGKYAEAERAYRDAMNERPMMDFEFERVREKAEELADGDVGPRLRALTAENAGGDPLARCQQLIDLRNKAGGASEETKQHIREAIAQRCDPVALRPALAADAKAALDQTLPLVEAAQRSVNQAVLERLVTVLDDALARPWLPAAPGTALERMEAVCKLRERLRALPVPTATDARLDAELDRLAAAGFVPATPANARARFLELLGTRTRARALHLPAKALAMVDAAHDDALALVLADATRLAGERHYLAVHEALAPLSTKVEANHPLRARHEALLGEGVAFHRQAAQDTPSGYRRLLHLALAASLSNGAQRGPATALQQELRSDYVTTLAPKVTLDATGACAAAGATLLGSLGVGTKHPVTLRLQRCVSDARDGVQQRSANYVTEEAYFVQETVQVGTRRVQVQTGSHQEQCSKASSLPGYTWQGLCTVPEYGWKDEPVYETRQVQKVRDRNGSVSYSVTTRVITAEVSGVAQLTWDDGTVLEVPVRGEWRDSAEQYTYQLPPRRLEGRPEAFSARIGATFTAATALERASANAGSQLRAAATAKARAQRAKLAREDGVKARAAGDEAAAGEAFVRSVLLDDTAEGEAAKWLEAQLGVSASLVSPVLVQAGVARRVPDTAAVLINPPAWVSPGLVAKAGVSDPAPKDVSQITQRVYHEGIRGPAVYVDFHFGLVPWDVQVAGAALGTRVAIPLTADLHYHPLATLLPLRYGFAVHDDAGLRGTFGFHTAAPRKYENGDKEPVLAASIDVSYALYLGLRTHYFNVYAGASAGFQHAASGQTWASAGHLEPAARVGLRLFRTYQLLIEATGFLPFVPGVTRKDRLSISFPILGSLGFDVKLSVERTTMPGSTLADDGKTRVDIGPVIFQSAGVQIGARL